MTNRKKIERFCKNNQITLIDCQIHRYAEPSPGGYSNVTEYLVSVDIDGTVIETSSGGRGDTTAEEVILMLEDLEFEMENIRGTHND